VTGGVGPDGRSRSPSSSGEAVLSFERILRHPPEAVWSALTDPAQIREWFLTEAQIEGRPGGRVDLRTGPTQVHATGRVLAWDPPHVYEYEWNAEPGGGIQYGERSRVRWELTPVPGGTRLVLRHVGLHRATAEVFNHGYPGFLRRDPLRRGER
jgi:uncharacterized protein YndB with AHSA1/START domain